MLVLPLLVLIFAFVLFFQLPLESVLSVELLGVQFLHEFEFLLEIFNPSGCCEFSPVDFLRRIACFRRELLLQSGNLLIVLGHLLF